ncbi:hypothetical protein CLOM_g8334 [Closterium sp. NIES-68]|nr:hypothetical protein CLOM_g8334 [Closterium sp. NIES-68]GJP59254.1 hypothetical protein CLOP_g10067 [Closterium sp. NIES-67]
MANFRTVGQRVLCPATNCIDISNALEEAVVKMPRLGFGTYMPSRSPRRSPAVAQLALLILLSSHLPLHAAQQGLVLVPPPPDDSTPIAAPPAARQLAASSSIPHSNLPRGSADVEEAYSDVSSLSIGLANSTIPSLEHADVEVVVPRRAGDDGEDASRSGREARDGEEGRGGGRGEEAGFKSMDAMLQWAIERSDPVALQQRAKEVSELTAEELEAKRKHIRDVLDAMRMPSDAELMRTAIADIQPAALTAAAAVHVAGAAAEQAASEAHVHVLRALHELSELVEPVHNANDLHKLGGLEPLGGLLGHESGEVRGMAALVLGKAVQNNRQVQQQALDSGVLAHLFARLRAPHPVPPLGEEEHSRLLFALSAAIRGHMAALDWFYSHGGVGLLARLLSLPSSPPRLRRKALFLLAGLAESGGRGPGGEGAGADVEGEQEGGEGVRIVGGATGEESSKQGVRANGEGVQGGAEGQGGEERLADEGLMRAVVGLLKGGGGEGDAADGGGEGGAGQGTVWRRNKDGSSTWDLDMLDKATAALHGLLAASPATQAELLRCCPTASAVGRVREALQAHIGALQQRGDDAEYEGEVEQRLGALLRAVQDAQGREIG